MGEHFPKPESELDLARVYYTTILDRYITI